MIYGNVEKIKKFDLQELNKLQGIEFEDIVDYDFLLLLCDYVQKYQINIGFYLDKDNKLQYLFFGNYNDLPIEDAGEFDLPNGRLFMITLGQSMQVNNLDKSYLRKKHLQFFCKILFDGSIKGAEIALLDVDEVKLVEINSVEFINKYGLEEKLQDCKENFKNLSKQGFSTESLQERAILVGIGRRGEDIESCLNELEGLAKTNNIVVVGKFMQTRKMPDKMFHIGVGKLDELRDAIAQTQANVVIFDDELSSNKIRNLEDELNVKVTDRANVILDIFAKRAKSNEGRLQVNLARMKYNFTRVNAFQNTASKGLGMRGAGETQMELNRRILKNKMYSVEQQIKELKKQRELRRLRRKENSEKVVALVGYTNAGKSTLLNKLTYADALAEDMLFATLDTMTRECYLDPNSKVLLTDTVGFIDKLPHEFIDAFSATLEESIESNLLLIVVDISDPECQRKYEVVMDTLAKIKANNVPSIVVLNKGDCQNKFSINTSKTTIEISAKSGENIPQLKKLIKQQLF